MEVVSKSGVRKRFSRKRKSAWRKHILVNEVEKYLEDSRVEGKLKKLGENTQFSVACEEPEEKVQKKCRTTKDAVLRCHFTPSIDNQIEPIRNPAPNKAKKEDPIKPKYPIKVVVYDGEEEEEEDELVKSTEKNVYDVWGSKETSTADDIDIHGKTICKQIPVKPPSHTYKKTNMTPALPIPMPGMSYNPLPQDHEELIMTAYNVELEKDRRKAKLTNALDGMFPSKADAPTEESMLREMSEGLTMLVDDEDEDDEEGEEGEGVYRVSNNPPVRRDNKKTERTRRKMKERKEEEERLKREKGIKVKDTDIYSLKNVNKLLGQVEMTSALKASWKRYDAELTKDAPKKLGKARFVEPDLEVKLSDELSGSLRTLEPEGHILKDLLYSVQRRSMLPASAIVKHRKKQRILKPKVYEKQSHKSVTL